ncbi:hypothetical protein EI976_18595 [Bacillus licheniformis]|uniref:hypothetical protein n=1 Tax=Bacillus subtilis group TaxID=653685 RepID=UPI00038E45AB|nr:MULTISPECIES: hypothetical protein [Bacillus subtilis group]EQM25208.1 hypothetical protein N399_24730 [Bacillus licheniformis CG-B52]KAA0816004.1 hypothetical protein EI978_00055 [Bacillus licheniformis]KAA0820284.1 hypothetical protein EI976_18595 [Bacillus licheniformis]KAA0822845.1 hypothetical protein EI973_17895 [Bacillus licheniformis]MEC0392448.1 hypothetical protein [Bacillus subtilis]
MFYLLLSIASIMLVIIGLFQLIYFNPNRTDQNGKKITRKRLIFAVIFFTVSSICLYDFGYNTPERKEAKYLNSVFKESDKANKILKDSAKQSLTDNDLEKIAQKLYKIKDNIKKLDPPETLPTEVRSSQKTLEDGLGKIIEGVRYNDSKELENGQTVTTMALILFESYVQKQSDVKKMIDDKYIENFILDN